MHRTKSNCLSDEFASKPIPQLIGKFFWPTLLASILASINDIVDRIYIGQGIGAEALSGVILVFPIMLGVMAFVSLTSTGTSVKISTALGAKDNENAELALGNSTVINAIIGIAGLLFILFTKEDLLQLFGVSNVTKSYADDYLSVIAIGWSVLPVGANFLGVARSEGNVRLAMYVASAAIVLNIIFDPIFIFWFKMGVKGAAWASVIASVSTLVWGIFHFNGKYSIVKLQTSAFKLKGKLILEIVKLGIAPFSMAISMSFVQGITNTQLTKYGGELAIGVLGVIMSIMALMMYVIRSLAGSAQPIISYNLGAKKYDRINQTILYLIKMSTIISCVAFAIIMLFPDFLVTLFSRENDAFRSLGVNGLRLSSLALPLYGIMMIGSQYFIAVGQSIKATILNLLQQVIIYLPTLYILGYYFGLDGLWITNSVSIGLAALIILFFLVKEYKHLKLLNRQFAIVQKNTSLNTQQVYQSL
ncbi:MATE family efflux transporter [Prolixibacteraceae bacterium JC049]|nr:MATE family efflux transporter [Prolixibacteraceae bacterium JC049]